MSLSPGRAANSWKRTIPLENLEETGTLENGDGELSDALSLCRSTTFRRDHDDCADCDLQDVSSLHFDLPSQPRADKRPRQADAEYHAENQQ